MKNPLDDPLQALFILDDPWVWKPECKYCSPVHLEMSSEIVVPKLVTARQDWISSEVLEK